MNNNCWLVTFTRHRQAGVVLFGGQFEGELDDVLVVGEEFVVRLAVSS